jgi:hypothetical protein
MMEAPNFSASHVPASIGDTVLIGLLLEQSLRETLDIAQGEYGTNR